MLTSPLDIINRLYPKARITSGYRPPNHPLSLKNPNSPHIHGTLENPGAVDVAPIPGVSFDGYVASLRNAGLPVSGALDEAAHPKPWTTGPNWHVSLLGQSQPMPQRKPRTLADMGKSAFPMQGGIDPLAPTPEPYYAPQQQAAPATLADLGQSKFPVAANGKDPLAAKKPAAFGKGGIGWKILGVLGDSYLEANGHEGNYVPNLMRQRAAQAEADQRREEFAQQLELQRQKSLEPPQFVQNAQAWAALPPEMKRAVLTQQDAMNPINVSTPMGTQNVARTSVKQINGKNYYSIGGEWYEEGE